MKRSFILPVLLLFLTGCGGGGNDTSEPQLSEIQGKVVSSTMNDITILSDGSTVVVNTSEADPFSVPGVLIDDVVKISYTRGRDENGRRVLNAAKLDFVSRSPYYYIKAEWLTPVSSIITGETEWLGFVLRNDGTARPVGRQFPGLKAWKLVGTTLTLISETEASVSSKMKSKSKKKGKEMMDVTDVFDIISIDAGQLVLSRGDREPVTYHRQMEQ